MKQWLLLLTFLILLSIGAVVLYQDRLLSRFFAPTTTNVSQGVTQQTLPTPPPNTTPAPDSEVIAQNLTIPWDIAFLPEGEILVTERPGTLLKIAPERQVIEEIAGVEHIGEGGLMGITLHPDFALNRFLYLYSTTRTSAGLSNRIERYRFENNQLSDRTVILADIRGAQNHDGGRLEFGPDGYLYITTGDAGQENLAQDTGSLNGKILRLTDDGSIPPDNPFNNAVYSYGHRNPQGLAWDEQNRLWISEHGPSGLQSGCDEINLIEPGGNYGWPTARCDQNRDGMIPPAIQSGRDDTWAPAGAAYLQNSLFFVGLRGASLYQAQVSDEAVTDFTAHFRNDYGRLRIARVGPDGFLYIATSNTDGRGQPHQGDDQIIRLNPQIFTQ